MSEREGVRGLVELRQIAYEMRERQVARRFKSQTLIDWADRIESALAAEGVQAGEVEQRARELLIRALEDGGAEETARIMRSCDDRDDWWATFAIRAIVAARAQQPAAVDEAMVERIVAAIVVHPMNNTDTETLRLCVASALTEARNVR